MKNYLHLKKSDCKNCYKCLRTCPVKAIRFSGNQAHIIEEECILCGQCFVVCPQNTKEIVSSIEEVTVLLQNNEKVFVSIAPSFVANYDGSGIDAMRKAIKQLGFYDVEETAIGATIVKKEYERILKDDRPAVLISSCCHSINLLFQKHFSESLDNLAAVVSPMQAHCLDIKRRYPDAKVVFIGPCIAKKDEVNFEPKLVDAVLTFEELSEMLDEKGIELEDISDDNENSKARFFPTTGGILKTMEQDRENYSYLAIDGVENCMAAIEDIKRGNIENCFIEMSACSGSCVNGPVMEKHHNYPVLDYLRVANYAGEKDFKIHSYQSDSLEKRMIELYKDNSTPSANEIKAVLKQIGKTKEEDELNCGSCGYNSCKDKAIAVIKGKAHISMCLPFLKEKAENFSDTIIENTPNAIIVLNEHFEVQQINNAALKLMNLTDSSSVMGEQVVRILDPQVFIDVHETKENIKNRKVYLSEYNRYVEQTILFDDEFRVFICLLRDISEQEKERVKKEEIGHKTIEITDEIINKQMRIVQEIASLLGETTAETKVALNKLKENISNE